MQTVCGSLPDTWSPTRQLTRILDAFDQWCLQHIIHISCRTRISNEEVRRRTDHTPLTRHIIRTTRPHIARANPTMDNSLALRAREAPLPRDWNRRTRHTWLRTIESDLAPLNIGLQLPITESRIVKPGTHSYRNGSVQHRTSHAMMIYIE